MESAMIDLSRQDPLEQDKNIDSRVKASAIIDSVFGEDQEEAVSLNGEESQSMEVVSEKNESDIAISQEAISSIEDSEDSNKEPEKGEPEKESEEMVSDKEESAKNDEN